MKAESIANLKKELVKLDQGDLLEAVLRLARFKKDNKELLTYFLFLSDDEPAFIESLCIVINEQFADTPNAHKKTLRKLIRWMDKCLRFSGIKETEVQVRLHFCKSLKASRTPIRKSKVIFNMYAGQLKKIRKAMEKFHEDIQYEYNRELERVDL